MVILLPGLGVGLVSPTLRPCGPGRISASTYCWYAIGGRVILLGMEVPIVGRGHELGQLRAALVAASGGAGRLVLVSGEPGIGKTRLAAAGGEVAGGEGVAVAGSPRTRRWPICCPRCCAAAAPGRSGLPGCRGRTSRNGCGGWEPAATWTGWLTGCGRVAAAIRCSCGCWWSVGRPLSRRGC